MQINKEVLKSLNPCFDRYEHFLEHHANFSGSLSDFMELPNVNYDDKIWVAEKVLTKNQAVSWAVLCAESVAHIFEEKYPEDKRFSDCIDFLKTVKDFNNLTDTETEEIEKHRDIIGDCYATNAAYYAALAARYAAHAARYALCVAAYNAIRAATNAATYASYAATYASYAANAASDSNKIAAQESQEELNIQFLRMACSL